MEETIQEWTQRHKRQRLETAAGLASMFKEARLGRGLKQYDLWPLTMVDQGQLSLWERGQIDLPAGRVRALLNAVGLDLAVVPLDCPEA